MKKSLASILILELLFSCMSNEASIEQADWYEKFKNKPLTKKEELYKQKLESRGLSKIDIQPPTIGVDASGSSFYSVRLNSEIIHTNDNIDSIKLLNFNISKELYSEVIEDSILFDISTISVTTIVKSSFEPNIYEEFYGSYTKKQLEKELKFKVVQKGNNRFERITIN